MVLLQISPEILRMSSNRKMLGSKGILTPMIHGLLRSKVCEPSKTADAVKFRNRRYSPDERR